MLPQDPILFSQVVDQILLLMVQLIRRLVKTRNKRECEIAKAYEPTPDVIQKAKSMSRGPYKGRLS